VVRRHWGVQTVHQILDVAFAEDDQPWIPSLPRAGPAGMICPSLLDNPTRQNEPRSRRAQARLGCRPPCGSILLLLRTESASQCAPPPGRSRAPRRTPIAGASTPTPTASSAAAGWRAARATGSRRRVPSSFPCTCSAPCSGAKCSLRSSRLGEMAGWCCPPPAPARR
jgi:hypothetical protein